LRFGCDLSSSRSSRSSSNNAGRPRDTVRWAEAVIALDPHGPVGDAARGMAALGHTALGHADDAERHLRAAIARPSSPTKRAESLAQLAGCRMACEGRTQLPEDRSTQQAALVFLGRAALLIDEPERAESFLKEYLELEPEPVSYPFVYYHLAECRRRAGDEAGGHEFDTKAASAEFGTRWERLARQRLAGPRAEGS
jgi:hypothetical protein